MDMAQNELAVAVAAPAPVPAPVPAPTLATIPVALTGWWPCTIAELEAAGIGEVSPDPSELMYMLAPAPVPLCTPPPTVAPAPVRLAAPVALVPVPVRPSQRHGTLPSTATSQRRQLPSSRAPPVDRAMIRCFIYM